MRHRIKVVLVDDFFYSRKHLSKFNPIRRHCHKMSLTFTIKKNWKLNSSNLSEFLFLLVINSKSLNILLYSPCRRSKLNRFCVCVCMFFFRRFLGKNHLSQFGCFIDIDSMSEFHAVAWSMNLFDFFFSFFIHKKKKIHIDLWWKMNVGIFIGIDCFSCSYSFDL